MSPPRRNKKLRPSLLVIKSRSPAKRKPDVALRSSRILALIPPVVSEGSSSSSDEEEVGLGCKISKEENDRLEVDYISNDMEATLADVMSEVQVTEEFLEQQEIMLMSDPPVQDLFDSFVREPSENLAPEQSKQNENRQVAGTSTSGSSRTDDHSYASPSTSHGPGHDHKAFSDTSLVVGNKKSVLSNDIQISKVKRNKKKALSKVQAKINLNKKQKLQVKNKKKVMPVNFIWNKNTPFLGVVTETATNYNLNPPDLKSTSSPTEFFSKVFTQEIWDLIVEQTNLYSCQVTGKSLNVNVSEMKGFVGILILMGIVDMPSYTDYWSNDLRYEKVASTMSLKRFQAIRRYIHFSNNELTENQSDRYYKIRPLLELVRKNFLSIPEEGSYSIDEMMVPYKGKKAGNRRQYVKNKPKKWGFKIFVRSGVSGMIYDFIVYGGEGTFRGYKFSNAEDLLGVGAKVVISLCKSIVKPTCSFVFFDNFFCSLELIVLLREKYGILSLGTVRSDRLRQCPLQPDKVLAKKGRGSYDMAVDNDHKVCVVKWEDNKCVCLASTYCEAEPVETIKRFPKRKKKQNSQPLSKVDVTCPHIVKQYNSFMGGVDLADMLIALYRTGFRTHRWYLAIFSQILDMCIMNAWLIYRRSHKVCGVGKQIPLKNFRQSIGESLIKTGKRYAPSPKCTPKEVEVKRPRRAPLEESRYDGLEHYPEMTSKGRCGFCKTGQTKMQCIKCSTRLCLTQEKNCFFMFHKKT